ncbi:MAG TPA: ATP-binding protein [Phycisphaerae bacterium]|nr:ATP-binding protein [Phycisphaerae bacterium]
MSTIALQPAGRVHPDLTPRERELGAIIEAYNRVTEQLKVSHERLGGEVQRLREELEGKNRELRRRERLAALGELAAGVAHEIRNPLGGIRLFASLLERDLRDRPESLRVVSKIVQGVTSLEAIVTDILDFARPPEAVPGRVELDKLLGEVIELAGPRIEQARVKVTVGAELAGVMLVTDGRLLQRVLMNLLLNAAQAAGRGDSGGEVAIALPEVSEHEIILTISDNGPGIPGELLDRIFNPFFTTKDTGTGLGLAIVHQIVEVLGGSVRASNRAEGGAEFALRLPRALATCKTRHAAG